MSDDFEVADLTPEEIDEAQTAFRHIDADGSGTLDEGEFRKYLSARRKGEFRCFPKLIIKFFGKDGEVSFEQFLAFHKALAAPPTSDTCLTRLIFDKIDTDHNGTIDLDEYKSVVNLFEFPPGAMIQEDLTGADYPTFKNRFHRLLKMAWSSRGY